MKMRLLTAAFVAALALLLPVAASAQRTVPIPRAILALTQRLVNSFNAADPSMMAGVCTNDAVMVDEHPPFTWRGARAGVAWIGDTLAAIRRMNAGSFHATAYAPSEFRIAGNDAYMTTPLVVSGVVHGKRVGKHGFETYTFRKTGGAWKIATAVWTTRP